MIIELLCDVRQCFNFYGSGSGIPGSGFRVQGLRFRVTGFRVVDVVNVPVLNCVVMILITVGSLRVSTPDFWV